MPADEPTHSTDGLVAQSLEASLTVRDLAASVVWYREVIGFDVAREYRRDERLIAVALEAGGVEILLVQDDGAKGSDRSKGETAFRYRSRLRRTLTRSPRAPRRTAGCSKQSHSVWPASVPSGCVILMASVSRSRHRANNDESSHCGKMTPAEFRRLALSLPEAVEGEHMGHADFRVGGRIFATLGYPKDGFAVVMLSPQDQDLIVRDHPGAFAPVTGKWGASGSTAVTLSAVDAASAAAVATALEAAWRKRAPKRLLAALDS